MGTYTQIACMLVQGCVETRLAQLLPELPHDAGKGDEGIWEEVWAPKRTNKAPWIGTLTNYIALTSANDPIPPLVKALLYCRYLGYLPDHSNIASLRHKAVMAGS